MKRVRSTLIVTLTLLSTTIFAAEVYKTFDADGNVVYSDRPAGDDSVAVAIRTHTPRPSLAAVQRSDSDRSQSELDEESADDNVDEETIAAAESAQKREDRIRNCALAQERNERYATAHRLYEEGENGERAYLDDAAIDNARADAIASVAEWCN